MTALTQGIGASREEIEQALGDREYVRDGRSYYLDGRAWAEFDGGVASLIAVDFADPPPLDSVNALLERLRPKDARLIDAGADASTTLLRVFESANIRDVFGEDRRYLERVRIDATSGEILGIEIAAEPAESHPR